MFVHTHFFVCVCLCVCMCVCVCVFVFVCVCVCVCVCVSTTAVVEVPQRAVEYSVWRVWMCRCLYACIHRYTLKGSQFDYNLNVYIHVFTELTDHMNTHNGLIIKHTATHCNTRNTRQHTATHGSTRQHTATHTHTHTHTRMYIFD